MDPRRDASTSLGMTATTTATKNGHTRAGVPAVRLCLSPFNPPFDPGAPGLRALRFDRAHRPSFDPEALDGERVEGRLSKGNPQSAIRSGCKRGVRMCWQSPNSLCMIPGQVTNRCRSA